MILISSFLQQVDYLITADNNELSQAARYNAIKAAVERYSADRPYIHADDVTGNAGRFYEVASVLANWVEGFSRIEAIEYPAHAITSTGYRPVYLLPLDWQDDFWASDKRYLYLPNHAPAVAETMRITYSVPWDWTPTAVTAHVSQNGHGLAANDYVYYTTTWVKASTPLLATHKVTAVDAIAAPALVSNGFTAGELQVGIREQHFHAVCCLAAAGCCLALATKYASGSDSTIGADSVQRTNNAGEYASRAENFVKLYEQGIGQGKDVAPAQATGRFVEMPPEAGWPGNRDFLFHGGRMRRGPGRRP